MEMFETLRREFPNLTDEDVTFVNKETALLAPLLGDVDIRGGEAGANVSIDGRDRGTLPLSAPVRVSVGSHAVRVFKSGYSPYDTQIDVAGQETVHVSARLNALARSGLLKVVEQTGRGASVTVDNVVVGPAPWEGSVSAGDHVVLLVGEGSDATQPAYVRVNNGATTQLTLTLETLAAELRVDPVPAGALVAIDGVSTGRGVWEGRLRSGPHTLEVATEGSCRKENNLPSPTESAVSSNLGWIETRIRRCGPCRSAPSSSCGRARSWVRRSAAIWENAAGDPATSNGPPACRLVRRWATSPGRTAASRSSSTVDTPR
jgi:hypothetical protein